MKDQKYEKLKMKWNSTVASYKQTRAFAIPILITSTFIMFDTIAVRMGIANALELTFVLWLVTVEFHSIFNLFPYFYH